MFAKRQKKIIDVLGNQGLDGLVLNAGPSLTYFTGLHFHLMERPVVLFLAFGKTPQIVLPELEKAKLENLDFALEAYPYPENPSLWPPLFKKACDSLGLGEKRIGFEPRQLRLLEYSYLTGAAEDISFHPGDKAIALCRSIKDATEVERMQKAVNIAQESLAATLPLIRAGMSEQELASELIVQLYRHGAEQTLPFPPIVSAGVNGANPHAVPSSRQLMSGDLLIIDWGASWQGYSSDLTRTFAIGEADAQARHIHALVQQANEAGRRAAKPGITCSAVDDAARSVIDAAGYGSCFHHRTGHGIGMECHEEPYIYNGNDEILRPGMTFTVEPGIYLAGKNGVRIEDDVLITSDGSRSLSNFSRELIVVGV